MQTLYEEIFPPDTARIPTEIDFAFFVDLSIHTYVSKSRAKKARTIINAEEAKIGQSLSSARVRQIVGDIFVAGIKKNALSRKRKALGRALTSTEIQQAIKDSQVKARLGRNVCYYAHELNIENLSTEEKEAWLLYDSLHVSSFGLSDTRIYESSFGQVE